MRGNKMSEYHYTECGLDNIYLINGFKITQTEDEQEIISINDINGLHKSIGLMIVLKSGLLSGKEIKFIRHTLDWSQKRLAQFLGVDYQTILRWEKHKGDISKTADRLLKTLFFIYINSEKNDVIYDKINEIADLDSTLINRSKVEKIKFEEVLSEWRKVA